MLAGLPEHHGKYHDQPLCDLIYDIGIVRGAFTSFGGDVVLPRSCEGGGGRLCGCRAGQ